MPLTLSGTLHQPTVDSPLKTTRVLFRARVTSDHTLQGATAEITTDDNGAYSVDLYNGRYDIGVYLSGHLYFLARDVLIDDKSTAATLNELIINAEYEDDITPPVIAEFRTLHAETVAARDDAQSAATSAGNSAASAGDSAQSAATAATSADQAAGQASAAANSAASAKTAAESARNTAVTKAGEAASDASQASQAKSDADDAAIVAQTSATTADTRARDADNSAGAAATSKNNAAQSASDAASSEANAASSEANASQSENAAAGSAGDAAQSATNAANSASAAQQYAQTIDVDIIQRDALRAAVEAHSGGRMTVLYDDAGNPNHMHVLPRFTYQDLGLATELGAGTVSAFVVDGVEKSEIFIGAYQASQIGALACSMPGAVPWVSIKWDDAVAACTGKGAGWHLMTMHEWAAVAYWCHANGFQPRGNTDNTRAHDASHEVGIDANQSDETLTGSGPAAWRHAGDHTGIADLVGNVWEWQHGMKLVDGEIFAAVDNDCTQPDTAWPSAGKFIRNDLGSNPTLAESGSANETYQSVNWADTPVDSGYTSSQLLRRLLIEPSGIDLQGRLYARGFGERLPLRGGNRSAGGRAGLGALALPSGRGRRSSYIGFRPAFVT